MTINLELYLNEWDIEAIVVTALEGGIGHWACLDNTGIEFKNAPKDEPVSITATKILLDGGTLKFDDTESDDRWDLTLAMLIEGIKTFWDGHDHNGVIRNSCLDGDELDASDANFIFQFAMFGDIVFG